jgi:hypothetical protein
MMGYDTWKATNPDDDTLDPAPEWPEDIYATQAEATAAARDAGLVPRQYRLAPLPVGWSVEPEFFG